MKHLLIIALFLVGMLSHATTVKKDTVYTHINSLLKTINTTKKQKATYYVTLTTKDNDSIKLRIDFRKLKANIPIYSSKNTHFDIKAFLSLNQEQVNQTNQKFKAYDDKKKEYGVASKQLRALEKQLAQLKAVDSSQLDTIAIADLQEKIQTKQETKTQLQQSYENLFSTYEAQRNLLLGNLQIDYRQRVRTAINEAYKKLKKRETKFQSFDDDALFYDIRINLLKVDATRAMKVDYHVRGKEESVTGDISAGKTYFISHFAEFGAYYEEEQVKAIFKAIKRQEAQRNPYLPYEPFALVTSDKELTQEYINRIVDYKNYKPTKYAAIKSLFKKEELAYKEIAEARSLIKLVKDPNKKKEFYLELQKKVPYYSQIDNFKDKHRSCNITALAMNLNFMGKGVDHTRLPDHLLVEAKKKKITDSQTWRDLAGEFDVKSDSKNDYIELYAANNKSESELKKYLTDLMLPVLERGSSISLSLFRRCKGHIIRVQEVTQNGIVIDDPYGYCPLKCILARESCQKNTYRNQGSRNNAPDYYGNDVTYSWEVLTQTTLKYMIIFNE